MEVVNPETVADDPPTPMPPPFSFSNSDLMISLENLGIDVIYWPK